MTANVSLYVLLAPLLLLLVGLLPSGWANRNPLLSGKLCHRAATGALLVSILAAVLREMLSARAFSPHAIELPFGPTELSIDVFYNSVTMILLMLVSFVGMIVSRYSIRYLQGDPGQGRFFKWLSLTLASILSLIASGNLIMFFVAWVSTSLCLHQLLMFYGDRPAAVLAAHKKFVASRIGDVSLIAAIVLIGSSLHTFEFSEIFRVMASHQGNLPIALKLAAFLVVLSAALKSAQFPLHGWLIQVIEAPTPVSALLHAGIVNAGAFLVFRMSPVLSRSPEALGLLAAIGLVTLALASLVMLTQTSIKVSLAWSTVAQMGFMLLECGLGLYSLAMLHLVAHSFYKAHAFLASGSGVDAFRAPQFAYAPSGFRPGRLTLSLVISILSTGAIAYLFGLAPGQQPAILATTAIVAIALTQLLLQAANTDRSASFLFRALGMSLLACISYFALHDFFAGLMQDSALPVLTTGGFQYALAVLVVIFFIFLLVLQHIFRNAKGRAWEAIYVHLYNGMYVDVYITRMLQKLWPVTQKIRA
ncbi:MAG: NADH-quinone oxidoreductase subunit L [Burkholderiales bacterium]